MMRELIEKTGTTEYIGFLTGSNNFRKKIYPEYKANRTKPPPAYLNDARSYLCTTWNARVTEGYEADDALGIYGTLHPNALICSNDKDLLQLPGKHFNIVSGVVTDVDEVTAWRTFYQQMLLGDRSDNVPGFDGMARQKPTKQIEAWYKELAMLTDPTEMWSFVEERFEVDPLLTAQLLYIWRKEPDEFRPPKQGQVTQ